MKSIEYTASTSTGGAARSLVTAGKVVAMPPFSKVSKPTTLLDRPVWSALMSRQRHVAIADGLARMFCPEIGPFAALGSQGVGAVHGLIRLAARHPHFAVFLEVGDIPIPKGFRLRNSALGVQMIAERPIAPPDAADIRRLSDKDAPEMLQLARLTVPGPFARRTHTLGGFWGVRRNGRLVAMAGERMKLPGYTELSGVCVHPDHRGRGLAAMLSAKVANEVQGRGETVFLHAYADNTRAIKVYERLGFQIRTNVNVVALECKPTI